MAAVIDYGDDHLPIVAARLGFAGRDRGLAVVQGQAGFGFHVIQSSSAIAIPHDLA
jgi:hypothetical protein